jgi:hypothetical protein
VLALTLQYLLFIFVAAVGVIQIAAARAGLRGLLLTTSRGSSFALGVVLVVGGFSWFFGILDRNVRGLEGMEQAVLFVPAGIAAVAATFVVSSLLHRARRADSRPIAKGGGRFRPTLRRGVRARGLEALRYTTYLDALFEEDQGPLR